ncbi:MAG: hypothetical protein UY04_C0010G0009 [Parcubacteria group bacterium GW2011_GWA2_47_7]|nr:MAG: hypothetical protein UY04_C0010G0009 [Parcubacteria group bacterium GW2011_GWA2_47_7]
MQLSSIKEYLEKYANKLTHEDEKRSSLLFIIKDQTGVNLNEKDISVVKNVIIVKASTIVKNELFLHKETILKKINESGRTDIFDIR